jgi:hypothetical protein
MLRFSPCEKYFTIATGDYINVYVSDKRKYLFTVRTSSNYGFVTHMDEVLFFRENQFYKLRQGLFLCPFLAEQCLPSHGDPRFETKEKPEETSREEEKPEETSREEEKPEEKPKETRPKEIRLEDMELKYACLIPTGKYEDINKVCGDYRAVNSGSAYLTVYDKEKELFIIKMNTYRKYKEVFVVEFFVHEGQTLLVVNVIHGNLSIYNMKGEHLHDDKHIDKFISSFEIIDHEYIFSNEWFWQPLFEQKIYKISSLLTIPDYNGRLLYMDDGDYCEWENTVENGKIVMPSGDSFPPSILYEHGLYDIQTQMLLKEDSFLPRLIKGEHNIKLIVDEDFLPLSNLDYTTESRYMMNKLTHVNIDITNLYNTLFSHYHDFCKKKEVLIISLPLSKNDTYFNLVFTFTLPSKVLDENSLLQISIEKEKES